MYELLKPLWNNPLITVTWLVILFRIFRPMKASDGNPSNSLTGLFVTTLVIFTIVILDTKNDSPQSVTPPASPAPPAPIVSSDNKPPAKVGRGRRTIPTLRSYPTVSSNNKTRSVMKEKYGILYGVWFGWLLLYLLSHKGKLVWDMMLRFITAVRGKFNPLPASEDIIDRHIVNSLEEDTSPQNKDWGIRMILAKQGTVSSTTAGTTKESSTTGSTDIMDGREGSDTIPAHLRK